MFLLRFFFFFGLKVLLVLVFVMLTLDVSIVKIYFFDNRTLRMLLVFQAVSDVHLPREVHVRNVRKRHFKTLHYLDGDHLDRSSIPSGYPCVRVLIAPWGKYALSNFKLRVTA